MSDWGLYLYIIGMGLAVVVLVRAIGKRKRLKKYTEISLGMSEEEMLDIMGGGYNKSLLAGNKTKYEWRIGSSSYGSHGYRAYSGVSKVDIIVKNGTVYEVKPYNVH